MAEVEKCSDCGRLAFLGNTVTIPIAEYEKLLLDAHAGRSVKQISDFRSVSRSGIGLNPDLAEFILDRAPTMTVKMIRAACIERFGDNTPSRSSIYRFIDKMRGLRR